MFNVLRIKNFRSIKDSKDLKLSNLNIIVGPNNSGKSSILYSILLLKQTLEDKDWNAALVTSGPYLDLGSYLDLINANDPEKSLEINLELNKSLLQKIERYSILKPLDNLMKKCNRYQIKFKFDKNKNNIYVSAFNISNSKSGEFYAGEYINEEWVLSGFPKEILPHMITIFTHFLPRFRSFGKRPKRDEKVSNKVVALLNTSIAVSLVFEEIFEQILYVGPVRQMIPRYGFLGTQYYSELNPSGQNLMKVLSTLKFYGRTKTSILTELNYWLDKKFHALKNIRITNIDPSETVISIYGDDPLGNKNINLALMGSGLSQLVPVIVQTVITPERGCIVIEQPEIHLHPAAQAVLGDLFVRYAKNKQIIVETHSEHLVLRVRRRVAEGKISPDLVSIFFVDKSKNETRIRKLDLQKDGNFRRWPAGFFEEGYREAMALAMAKPKVKSK